MPTRANPDGRRQQRRPFDECDRSRPAELWSTAKKVNFARFTTLVVCAFCGSVKQGDHQDWRKVQPFSNNEPAPYVITNPALQEYTKVENKWWACSQCAKQKHRLSRAKWLPYYANTYLSGLYSLHPLQSMLLSLLDISSNFANRCKSFLKGGLRPSSLFDCTYLTWNEIPINRLFSAELPPSLKDLLATSQAHNPLYKKYLCLCEQPGLFAQLPILASSAVQTMMGTHRTQAPYPNSDTDFVSSQHQTC